MKSGADERDISLGEGCSRVPERLLLAHGRGEVLFVCGAGVSKQACLPDFKGLVLEVYKECDPSVYEVCKEKETCCYGLTDNQKAEVRRFRDGNYDIVLGMLERRLNGRQRSDSIVRDKVVACLQQRSEDGPAPIHCTLMRLADRGVSVAIATTNYDLLLEEAGTRLQSPVETYSLGSIPWPTRKDDFAGVFHLHGALEKQENRASQLILTDHDFGEFYMRRRIVPDFIYDAARLYHLVLVGYSAQDLPMQYLLNAVASDSFRFPDLKERFIFSGSSLHDAKLLVEDWKARGITPIHYDCKEEHVVLSNTFKRWAELSAFNRDAMAVEKEIRRIVEVGRADASEEERDLFDHLLRRSNLNEFRQLTEIATEAKATLGWLDAIVEIGTEKNRRHQP